MFKTLLSATLISSSLALGYNADRLPDFTASIAEQVGTELVSFKNWFSPDPAEAAISCLQGLSSLAEVKQCLPQVKALQNAVGEQEAKRILGPTILRKASKEVSSRNPLFEAMVEGLATQMEQ